MPQVVGELLDQGGAVFNVKAYKTTSNSWYDAITAAIAAAQAVGGTVLFPAGTFTVSQSIKVPSGISLVGVGMWNSVVKWAGQPPQPWDNKGTALFDLTGPEFSPTKQKIRIADLGMEGDNTSVVPPPFGSAPRMVFMDTTSSDIVIERCRFEYAFGAGVAAFQSHRVVVRDCVASRNGETGINVNAVHGQITGNRCEDNGYAGIESSSAFTLISRNYVRGNRIHGMTVGGFTQGGQFARGYFNVVTDNICVLNNGGGLVITAGTGYSVVANNVCHANELYGIGVIDQRGAYPGVFTEHNLVHNNIVTSNGKAGAGNFYGVLVQAPWTRISGNKVADVSDVVFDVDTTTGYQQGYGILVTLGDGNELIDNDSRGHSIRDYSFEGFYPQDSVLQYLRPGFSSEQVLGPSSFAPTAKQVLQETTGALGFGSIAAQQTAELDVAVSGALVGSPATASPLGSLGSAALTWSAYVPVANTVRVRVTNVGTAAVTPASIQWTVGVILPTPA